MKRLLKSAGLLRLVILALLVVFGLTTASAEKILRFSGLDWAVRPKGMGAPGPNHWDPRNAWVDELGYLHLTYTTRNGKWSGAEVYTTQKFGFGQYQFWIGGRVDDLDKNLVLGMFPYPEAVPDSKKSVDGTREIDIEFSRWGLTTAPMLNYTVWPVKDGLKSQTQSYHINLKNNRSTHRFIWGPNNVYFQSLDGWIYSNEGQIAAWNYHPKDFKDHIAQTPMPVHINLWSVKGQPPFNGKSVEIIIRAFSYRSMAKKEDIL
jgi:hypothetical protein